MKPKELILEMTNIYQTFEYDWMGFSITKGNRLTYHHIIEKRNDGDESIENGALLGKKSHELLHLIEKFDKKLYHRWQRLFKKINSLKGIVTDEIIEEVLELKNLSLNCKGSLVDIKIKKSLLREKESTCI